MCKAMEDRINSEKLQIALNLLQVGDPPEKIALVTGLPLEKVKELAAELSRANA